MHARPDELQETYPLFENKDRFIHLKLFELNPHRSIFKAFAAGRAYKGTPKKIEKIPGIKPIHF
jgi:hypothetical protein